MLSLNSFMKYPKKSLSVSRGISNIPVGRVGRDDLFLRRFLEFPFHGVIGLFSYFIFFQIE